MYPTPAPGTPGAHYPQVPGAYPTPPGYPVGYPNGSWYPAPPPAPNRSKAVALALVGALVLGGGGYAAYHHFLGNGAGSNACSADGDRDVTVSKKSLDEPTVVIPLVEGWEPLSPEMMQKADSVLDMPPPTGINDAVLNNKIRENEFTPTIMVSVNTMPDRGLTDAEINASENRELATSHTINNTDTLTTCGTTVYQADSTTPGFPGHPPIHFTDLFAIQRNGDTIWGVDVVMMTTNPENPEYIAQRDALLEGLRVELPES